jgi:hypothetical protein
MSRTIVIPPLFVLLMPIIGKTSRAARSSTNRRAFTATANASWQLSSWVGCSALNEFRTHLRHNGRGREQQLILAVNRPR